MKTHHPDRLNSNKTSSTVALDLNQSYQVLRNPGKRAEYDELLRLQRRLDRPRLTTSKTGRRTVAGPITKGLAVAGIAIIIALSVDEFGRRPGFETLSSIGMGERGGLEPLSRIPLPEAREARALAQHALQLSHGEAEQFSRRCFARASTSATFSAGQPCILFDIAFLYWRLLPELDHSGPIYFSKDVTTQRHLDQMEPFGLQADARLARLRQTAFAAVMQMVQEYQEVELSRANMLDTLDTEASSDPEGLHQLVP